MMTRAETLAEFVDRLSPYARDLASAALGAFAAIRVYREVAALRLVEAAVQDPGASARARLLVAAALLVDPDTIDEDAIRDARGLLDATSEDAR